MRERIQRFNEIRRNEGGQSALQAAFQWLPDRLRYTYYNISGETYDLEYGGISAEFTVNHYLGDFRELSYFENNEGQIVEDMIEEVDEDDVFLDIGANIGIVSVLLSGIVEKVYAVEPHPANNAHLIYNINMNDIQNVDPYSIAFASETGYITLEGVRGGLLADGSAAITDEQINIRSKKGPVDGMSQLNVRAETGDEIINSRMDIPDVIKIDVEGAEKDVISGLNKTLQNSKIRAVYCEVHSKGYGNVREELETFGFDINLIEDQYLKATRDV